MALNFYTFILTLQQHQELPLNLADKSFLRKLFLPFLLFIRSVLLSQISSVITDTVTTNR